MNDNPIVVKWSNEQVRPLCDRVAGMFQVLTLFQMEWVSKGLDDIIPNDETVIADGSATDGRTPITGADIHQIKALVADLLTMGTGENSRIPVILKAAVNPRV